MKLPTPTEFIAPAEGAIFTKGDILGLTPAQFKRASHCVEFIRSDNGKTVVKVNDPIHIKADVLVTVYGDQPVPVKPVKKKRTR